MAAAVDASDVPNKGGVYVPNTAPTAKAAPKAAPRGGGAQGGAQVTGADSSARHDAADERHGAQDDARRDAADERVQVDAVSLLAVREELKALAALWAYERRPLELKFRQTAPQHARAHHGALTSPQVRAPPSRAQVSSDGRVRAACFVAGTLAGAAEASPQHASAHHGALPSPQVRWQGLPTDALDAAFGRPAIDVHMKRQPPSSIMHAHDDHAHLLDLPAAATGRLCIRH